MTGIGSLPPYVASAYAGTELLKGALLEALTDIGLISL